MATQYGRSLEVSAEVEGLSTNSHSQGENSDEFIASTASEHAKLERVRGLFRRRKKTKDESEEKESVNKNRPYENRWIQQRIPSCRPIWHPVHVFILFIITAFIMCVLGSLFLGFSLTTREVQMDYTQCANVDNPAQTCDSFVANATALNNPNSTCTCRLELVVNQELRAPVHVYYGLTSYYQNHRRYVSSWSQTQISASDASALRDTAGCEPLQNDGSLPVVPCGLRANSLFNDSFALLNTSTNFSINRRDISWPTDRAVRFSSLTITEELLNGTTKPPNWPTDLSQLEGGLQNEGLIVWFRVSALPWFRKLYGRIETNVAPGTYTLQVQYNYRVTPFGGTKELILSEITWLGGRNHFLGAAYLVTGALCIAAGIAIMVIHFTCSKWKARSAGYRSAIGESQEGPHE